MKRLYYLDNLRVALTMLVIVFHTSIAYGGAGSWYYEDFDKSLGLTPSMVVFTIFTAVCQAFFMSLFFFLSAYFTPGSYDRKGPLAFLKDRLVRLGIPLAAFYFLIDPPVVWYLKFRETEPLAAFYRHAVFGFRQTFFGPTWFIETLLIYAVIYALVRLSAKPRGDGPPHRPFPSGRTLFLTAVLFGLIAFAVRLVFPTGTGPLELQLGYFPLYILMMAMGTVAYRRQWLERIPERLAAVWKWTAVGVIPLLPVALIATGALDGVMTVNGGMNVQAFLYALWEPFVCFGVSLTLLLYFRRRWNHTGKLAQALSGSAYTVYLIHPPVVIAWTLLFHRVPLPEMVKFLVVAPASVAACFLLAYGICRIPHVRKVL